ncbi:PDZ domain-containing protein 11-like [Saccostrea cucullata]|uniref:PDZ domain-containing protein 11-like n=1 Tax=Saccostrea cuccullata TaxID=36930 RepID=UPI002ED5B81A
MNQHQSRIELVRARLPPYEPPPPWIPPQERVHHPDYNNDIREFLPRELILQRMRASEQLGFNIRGGQEHHCGIFVSKVMPNSEADKLGLREGDQILTVNQRDFTNIDHAEAVRVLKMNTTIQMMVRFFPYGYDRTYDKCKFLASNQQAER